MGVCHTSQMKPIFMDVAYDILFSLHHLMLCAVEIRSANSVGIFRGNFFITVCLLPIFTAGLIRGNDDIIVLVQETTLHSAQD